MADGGHDAVQLQAVLLADLGPADLVLAHLLPVSQAQPLVLSPLLPLITVKTRDVPYIGEKNQWGGGEVGTCYLEENLERGREKKGKKETRREKGRKKQEERKN